MSSSPDGSGISRLVSSFLGRDDTGIQRTAGVMLMKKREIAAPYF
jgi:hypothetical protein